MPRPNAVPARARDGAHRSARPVVPCAHVTTGQPPLGARPFGRDTVPDTATALPATPAPVRLGLVRTLPDLGPLAAVRGPLPGQPPCRPWEWLTAELRA